MDMSSEVRVSGLIGPEALLKTTSAPMRVSFRSSGESASMVKLVDAGNVADGIVHQTDVLMVWSWIARPLDGVEEIVLQIVSRGADKIHVNV